MQILRANILYLCVFFLALNVEAAESDFPYTAAGLRWSKDLGAFSNGCISNEVLDLEYCSVDQKDGKPPTVQVLDVENKVGSKAAQECSKLGGRLPTKEDYLRLIKSLDHRKKGGQGATLTARGLEALSKAFGREAFKGYRPYWTASVVEKTCEDAVAFYFLDGSVARDARDCVNRFEQKYVRCVSDPVGQTP